MKLIYAKLGMDSTDIEFCTHLETAYRLIHKQMDKTMNQTENTSNELARMVEETPSITGLNEHFCGAVSSMWHYAANLNSWFIFDLIDYLSRKYSVGLRPFAIESALLQEHPKSDRMPEDKIELQRERAAVWLTAKDILAQVYLQTEGNTLRKYATARMLEDCRNAACGKDGRYENYHINSRTSIKFGPAACAWYGWKYSRFSLSSSMDAVIRAAVFFEGGDEPDMSGGELLQRFNGGISSPVIITGLEKIPRINLYKSGCVTLRFASKEYREQFAKEFLGDYSQKGKVAA